MAEERSTFESDMQDLLLEQETLNEQLTISSGKIRTLEDTLRDARISHDAGMRALIQTCIKSSENLTTRAIAENDVVITAGTSSYFRLVADELQEVLNGLVLVNAAYTNDPDNNGEGLARKVILAGHLLSTLHIQGMTICNTSADIETSERMYLNACGGSLKRKIV